MAVNEILALSLATQDDKAVPFAEQASQLLSSIGVPPALYSNGTLFARTPINGARIGKIREADGSSVDRVLARAAEAAQAWSAVTPARRGELIRRIGERLRDHREPLAQLISLEIGKTITESRRKVEFVISSCDRAFALSRELGQSTVRKEHDGVWVLEVWRSLGVTGCISPFNRPISHFAAHCFTSLVCGNSVVWKPSQNASLSALAMRSIVLEATNDVSEASGDLLGVLFGGRDIGKTLSEDFRLRFLDAATSTATGRALNIKLAQSFTRGALSLGGNHAAIVCQSADTKLAVNAIAASTMLSAGQHPMCIRRLFIHTDLYDLVVTRLKQLFERVLIGDPRIETTMMGPLIDRNAYEVMQRTLLAARNEDAVVTGGGRIEFSEFPGAYYVRPAIVEMPRQSELMLRETLAPILFVMPFESVAEAIALDGASDAGLSSTIFSRNMAEVSQFLQSPNSGIANVNTFNSGYEPGAAMGGAKASGGGRMSSSATWKAFQQRCAVTMNMSNADLSPDTLGMMERGEI